jgi:hypothetical protein
MKSAKMILSGAAALFALGTALYLSPSASQAQCTPPGDPSAQNINCTGSVVGYNAGGGDDTITISGNFSFFGTVSGNQGNDSISNSGNFSFSSSLYGDEGNDTILNSGNFSSFSLIQGGEGNDSISNSGDFSAGGILGGGGDDTISLLPGAAFDSNFASSAWVDGDYLNITTGNNDLLLLYVNSPVNFDTKFPQCQGQAAVLFLESAGCFVPWEGGRLYFTNFEKIRFILIETLAAQGVSVDIPAGPQVICDDGRVKVFKLPNGDVEYYSGFDILAPNGFMVARVSLLDLANGIRTFPTATQTPNPLGWTVVITQTGNTLSGQVVDENGNAVGASCRH